MSQRFTIHHEASQLPQRRKKLTAMRPAAWVSVRATAYIAAARACPSGSRDQASPATIARTSSGRNDQFHATIHPSRPTETTPRAVSAQ